jgi:hypothetical protein
MVTTWWCYVQLQHRTPSNANHLSVHAKPYPSHNSTPPGKKRANYKMEQEQFKTASFFSCHSSKKRDPHFSYRERAP